MRTSNIKYETIELDSWDDVPTIGAYHVIFPSGSERWFLDGKFHREDGPAIIWKNGDEWYFLHEVGYKKSDYYKELYKRELISKKELFIVLL